MIVNQTSVEDEEIAALEDLLCRARRRNDILRAALQDSENNVRILTRTIERMKSRRLTGEKH